MCDDGTCQVKEVFIEKGIFYYKITLSEVHSKTQFTRAQSGTSSDIITVPFFSSLMNIFKLYHLLFFYRRRFHSILLTGFLSIIMRSVSLKMHYYHHRSTLLQIMHGEHTDVSDVRIEIDQIEVAGG